MITRPPAESDPSFTQFDSSLETNRTAPQLFFVAAHRAFLSAETAAGGPIDRYYSIGGLSVHLRFAGPALVPHITRALAHLSSEPSSNPMLTICLWDSASTRTPMPPPPWNADDYRQGGEIRGFNDDQYFTGFQLDAGILSIVDRTRGLGVYWCRSANQIPDYEAAAPLRLVLHPWLRDRGLLPVHAGAVGLPSGGVLLAGKGGAGKSNAALACLISSLYYASDDFCLLQPKPILTAFSLYSTGKVHADDVHRLPWLAPMIWNREPLGSEKAVIFLNENLPEKILTRFPIRAILIAHVTGASETLLRPASPAAALAALTPGSLLLLPSVAQETFRMLAEIVRQVPCYWIDLGTDPTPIPGVILELLRSIPHQN